MTSLSLPGQPWPVGTGGTCRQGEQSTAANWFTGTGTGTDQSQLPQNGKFSAFTPAFSPCQRCSKRHDFVLVHHGAQQRRVRQHVITTHAAHTRLATVAPCVVKQRRQSTSRDRCWAARRWRQTRVMAAGAHQHTATTQTRSATNATENGTTAHIPIPTTPTLSHTKHGIVGFRAPTPAA